MYSVMLVDDDQPVLDFLSAMIPWDELGLTLHSACKNGLVALEKAQADMPDIVITDIGMPYMDGLELIRELKLRSEELRVVVLSCMDDFTYAQQAVKLMVSDYILKEMISRELITGLLRELCEDLRRRDADKAQTLKWKSMAEHQKVLLKQSVLRRIAARELPDSEWRADAAELGIMPDLTAHVAVLCRISGNAGESEPEELALMSWVESAAEAVRQEDTAAVCLPYSGRDCVLVFSGGMGNGADSGHISMLGSLRSAIQALPGVTASFQYLCIPAGSGHFREGIIDLLSQGREYAFYLKPGELNGLKMLPPFTEEDLFLHYAEAAQEIREAFLEEAADRLAALLSKWMDTIRARRYAPRQVKEWMLKLLYDNQMRLMARQQYQSTFSLELLHDTLTAIDHIDHLEEWSQQFFSERLPVIREMYQETRRDEIKKVKQYVDRHLNRKITLEEVAEYTHLNSSYFSRLFKKETGMSFIHYVTHTKMEQAKEWLDQSPQSVEQVAEQLGYENKSYFTKLFKLHTGTTPGEFRGEEGSRSAQTLGTRRHYPC
ncbi:response regulator transcription factor [Paenibacillus sp. FSL H3-0333]|uniref:response regulator transcription factor n=1 Tax=Paenibacillus sp. FSL H3-0333 TaxID=2921373 RepID=UPI0030F4F399